MVRMQVNPKPISHAYAVEVFLAHLSDIKVNIVLDLDELNHTDDDHTRRMIAMEIDYQQQTADRIRKIAEDLGLDLSQYSEAYRDLVVEKLR